MKLKIAFLTLLLIVLGCAGTWQYKHYSFKGLTRAQGFALFQPEPPALPAISLEAADIVRILSEYNIAQQGSGVFCHQLYGLTSFDIRSIEICEKVDKAQKELTLLHELYHIRYHEAGIQTGGPLEPTIEALAETRFQQLYGLPLPATAPGDPPKSQ